jgi:hypothetical protein
MAEPILVVTAESVTALEDVRGKVLVAGSHAGVIAAYLGAAAGAHALVLNDAGLGLDRAGIAGLAYLDALGMAAAAVDCRSARIGDGADMRARGVISHANAHAALCGVVPGLSCDEAAGRLCRAAPRRAEPPPYAEGRWRVAEGRPEVWALDSIGKVVAEDAGRILVIGSHGALHGGRPESALPVDALGAVFHDAGVGADRIGLSRLPVLAMRGIAAATVAGDSARIGDGRSLWATGRLSHVNTVAEALGVRAGMAVTAFVQRLAEAHQAR